MPSHAKDGRRHTALEGLLAALTRLTVRFPVLTLSLCLAAASASAAFTHASLRFKTSRADLIDPRTPYHQRWSAYTGEFGDVTEDIVVVVEADESSVIRRVLDDLGPRLEREPRLFKNVLYKVDLSRLRGKALQYSSPEQLQAIVEQLDDFSLLLKRFELLTLKGVFHELRTSLELAAGIAGRESESAIEPLLAQTAALVGSLDRFSHVDKTYESPWGAVVPGDLSRVGAEFRDRYLLNDRETMGFIKVQPTAASSDFNGTSPAIARLRELIADAGRRHPQARLGLTGIPVLESDEMRDSQTAMFYASLISFVGVSALMLLGFQGLRYPLVGSAVLLVGMAWSFGFTTLAVGHLNILSVSFAAMLIGIGIDYSTVYLLRYLEVRRTGLSTAQALVETARSAGAGIWTAAISSSVAFFCALLTDLAGVAELGLIAGGGILLCTVAAFVVLPAILAIVDRRHAAEELPRALESDGLRRLATRYPAGVVALASVAVAWVSSYGLDVKYDYNLLNLQAHGLESVEVQSRIFEQSEGSLLFAVSLADSPAQVLELKRKFEALPTVHHVEELAAMLPQPPFAQTQLYVQAIHAFLARLPSRPPEPRDVAPERIGEELEKIETLLATRTDPLAAATCERIGGFLDYLDELGGQAGAGPQLQLLSEYQARLSADLLARLRGLEAVSDVQPVSPDDLSPALTGRFLSPRGKWLLQVYPRSQVWDIEPLERFIAEVRSVDPDATGTPLQTYEASRAIKRSYELIGLYALAAVCAFLLLDFRNPVDCLLALLPPLAGAGLMFGILALCRLDLNPANLIVLPLVIGLGVDGGVHIVHDYRLQAGAYAPSASVVNAIIVNSTTTMVGFGSMMIAAHRGLYSLGLVLTIGVGTCLAVAIILVPAILTLRARRRASSASGTEAEPALPAVIEPAAEKAQDLDDRSTEAYPLAATFPPPPHFPLFESPVASPRESAWESRFPAWEELEARERDAQDRRAA